MWQDASSAGSRTYVFHSFQNQRPWMTLNNHYALYCTKHASFGAHCPPFTLWAPAHDTLHCHPVVPSMVGTGDVDLVALMSVGQTSFVMTLIWSLTIFADKL